jgi:sec-independent protein translocase protein TatB
LFDIGFWELSLIMVIILIVVGPERLPKMARTAGLWIAKVRRMVSDVKADVERELRAEELRGNLDKGALDDLKRAASEVRSIGRDLHRDVGESARSSTTPTPRLTNATPSSQESGIARDAAATPERETAEPESAGRGGTS